MHYKDIAEAIAEQELKTEFGATPAASVNAAVTFSIQNDGDESPFFRPARGYVSLKTFPEELEEEESPEEDEYEEAGLINAFGMYWRRDWVLWRPSPMILGQQQPGSTPVDFCNQNGVYLLHDGREVVYVGRTTDQPLGNRLRQHTIDRLNGRWDRFSWFGVYLVTEDGTISEEVGDEFSIDNLIATMEALFIETLEPPQNRKRGDEFRAVEYLQVEDPEIQKSQILQLMDSLKAKL
jgi:hypothetical protein